MKSYLRFLSRNRLYTAIEVVGLSVALAFVILLSSYIVDDMSVNKVLKNTDNVYLCLEDSKPYSFNRTDIYSDIPAIEERCCILLRPERIWSDIAHIIKDDQDNAVSLMASDRNFFEFFTFPLLEGNPEDVLASDNSIVISESFANRLFPEGNPIGKSLKLYSEGFFDNHLTVSGVFKEFPKSVIKQPDIIINLEVYRDSEYKAMGDGAYSASIDFIRLEKNASVADVESGLNHVYNKNRDAGSIRKKAILQFDEIRNQNDEYFAYVFDNIKDKETLNTYWIMCLFIVLASLFNYIALTIAFSRFRMKEIATRRLLGTDKSGVIVRCILEALLLLTVSAIFAILIAVALKTQVGSILGVRLDPMQHAGEFMILALIMGLMAVMASLLPSVAAVRHNPIVVIKGEERFIDKMYLSKGFICFEGLLSIFAIASCMVIVLQTNSMLNEPRGYETDNIIYIGFHSEQSNRFIDELRSESFIDKAGHLSALPSESWWQGYFNDEANENSYHNFYLKGDSTAFDILGIKRYDMDRKIAGNAYLGYMYLCESSHEEYSFLLNDNTLYSQGRSVYPTYQHMSGTASDFRLGTLKNMPEEGLTSIYVIPDELIQYNTPEGVIVKVNVNEREGIEKIRKFYEEKGYGDLHIDIKSAADVLEEAYREELNLRRLLILFTFVSIIITIMAITALSSYYAKINVRTSAIRKVFGISRKEIFWNTVWGFTAPVLVAAVVAVPAAYVYAEHWLKNYVVKIDNSPLIYICAVALVLLIVVAEVMLQALSLMRANPAEALKKE